MTHFKVDNQDSTTIPANYPRTPSDLAGSTQDYLEAMFASGWELVSAYPRYGGADWMFVFRTNEQ